MSNIMEDPACENTREVLRNLDKDELVEYVLAIVIVFPMLERIPIIGSLFKQLTRSAEVHGSIKKLALAVNEAMEADNKAFLERN